MRGKQENHGYEHQTMTMCTVDGWAQVYERPSRSESWVFSSVKHDEKPKSGCTPTDIVYSRDCILRVFVGRLRCSDSCTRRDFCALQIQVDRDEGKK